MEAAAAAAAAAGFAQQAVRQAFTRKVLLLVLLQVAFTTGIACVFMFVKPVKVRAPCWAVCVCLIQLAARAAGGADDMDLFVNAVKVRERLSCGMPRCICCWRATDVVCHDGCCLSAGPYIYVVDSALVSGTGLTE